MKPYFPRSIAAVVGIDDYGNGIPALANARRDAEAVAEVLAELGYQVLAPLTREVTRTRLEQFIRDLRRQVEPGDRLLFYFAGHGRAFDTDRGIAGFLLPENARPDSGTDSLLSMDWLKDALEAVDCHHRLVVLDCCFAGSFRWSMTRDVEFAPPVVHAELYRRYVSHPAWQILTSAAHDQRAMDALWGLAERGDVGGHSPFATALIAGLRGAADFMPRDGLVTATELYLYIRQAVETQVLTAGRRQTPGLWTLPDLEKGEYVFELADDLQLPAAPPLGLKANPYRGLKVYDAEHAEIFCGRQKIVDELASQVERCSLTVIAGPSGCGKSSILRAGLLPRIEKSWRVVGPLRPGPRPLAALAEALGLRQAVQLLEQAASAPEAATRGRLQDEIVSLLRVALTAAAADPDRPKTLIVIDQLEELVTMTPPAERRSFEQLLVLALDAAPKRFHVVVTVRSDFEHRFEQQAARVEPEAGSAFAAYWREGRLVVPPLRARELRHVILEPAMKRVLFFEHGLVDELIEDTVQMPGALPLLSFTLSALYVRYLDSGRTDRTLRHADYAELGRIEGALRQRADELWSQLDSRHRETLQRLMLRLVSLEGGEPLRRRAPLVELTQDDKLENGRLHDVIKRLSEERLVVVDGDEIEPAHDKLVTAWGRLRTWISEAGSDLIVSREVALQSEAWEAGRAGSWWNDARLFQLSHSGAQPKPWLSSRERRFFRRSLRLRRSLKGALALGVAGTLLFAARFYLQSQQNLDLRYSTLARGLANQVEADVSTGNIRRALLLARQAHLVDSSRGGRNDALIDRALRTALERTQPGSVLPHSPAAVALVFDPVTATLATGAGKELVLFEPGARRRLRTLRASGRINAAAWSDDGRFLATVSDDSAICVWAAGSWVRHCVQAEFTAWPPVDVDFIPGTHRLIVLCSDVGGSQLEVWEAGEADSPSLQHVDSWSNPALLAAPLAIDPAGRRVVVGDATGRLHSWHLDEGGASWVMHPRTPTETTFRFSALAFTADGRFLLGGSTNGAIARWVAGDLAAPDRIREPTGAAALTPGQRLSIEDIAVDPAGRFFVAAVTGGTLAWWRIDTFAPERPTIPQSAEQPLALAFSRDGAWLAASHVGADGDGAVELFPRIAETWQPRDTPSHTTTIVSRDDGIITLARHAARPYLVAVGGETGNVELWDLRRRRLLETWEAGTDWIEGLAFIGRGDAVVSASADHRVMVHSVAGVPGRSHAPSRRLPMRARVISAGHLWLAGLDKIDQSRDHVRLLRLPLRLGDEPLEQPLERGWMGLTLAVHPHREIVVIGGDGLRVLRREGGSWSLAKLAGPEDLVLDLAFSADGAWLAATGSRAHRGHVWLRQVNGATFGAATELANTDDRLMGVSFHGSTELAAASNDGRIYLWHLPDPAPTVFHGHSGPAYDVVFSSDGTRLASGALNGELFDWSLGISRLVAAVCAKAVSNLSWLDWQQRMGPDVPYDRTCANVPIHPSALVAADDLARRGEGALALKLYRRLDDLDPTLALEPSSRARTMAALGQLDTILTQPDPTPALSLLEQIVADGQGEHIAADDWAAVCAAGLRGGVATVDAACEQAILLAPYDPRLMLMRGIARAAAGHWSAAREDVAAALESGLADRVNVEGLDIESYPSRLEQRHNPFTQAVITRLLE